MNEEMAPEQEPEQSAPPPPVPQPAPQPTPQPRVPFWGWEDVMLFFGLGIPCLFVVELAAALVAKTFHVPQADPFVLVSGQTAGYVVLFSLLAGILRAQYNAPFWRSMGWVRSSIRPLTALLLGPPLALSVALLGGCCVFRTLIRR